MIDLALTASALKTSPDSWTVLISVGGLLAGALGAWLGYRGQSKSANAEETAAVFDGQNKLILNLQNELKRCNNDHRGNERRIGALEEKNDTLRDELNNLASDFHGLLMIVQDEIAKHAGEQSLARVMRTMQQSKRSPDDSAVGEEGRLEADEFGSSSDD